MLCDSRLELAPSPDIAVTRDAREVFGAGAEAVVLATNPHAHAKLALGALETGHHVLIEKPSSLSTRDAETVCRAATRAEKVVCVGHLLRHHTAYEKLVQLGSSGALGPIVGVVAERVGSRPRSDVDSWWMLAPHELSVLLSLFGRVADEVSRWTVGVDEFVAVARFDGVPAALWVRSGGHASRRFAIVGTGNTAFWDDLQGAGAIRLLPTARLPALRNICVDARSGAALGADALARALDQAARQSCEIVHVEGVPPLQRELAAFAAAIRGEAPMATDAAEGLAVVSMLEAGARAERANVGAMPRVGQCLVVDP